jgi:hypothetical protein
MYEGKLVFSQLIDHLPMHTFRRSVARYDGDRSVKHFTCQEQYRAMAFAQLTYRESLRDIEICLFFKWIKQHLRIKKFYGTSENAVKTQIWIAVSVYVLVAIVKKRLGLDASLYTLLQILSLTLFEKMPILQALSQAPPTSDDLAMDNQLNLFAS